MVGYSSRNLSIILKGSNKNDSIEICFTNDDIKQIVEHFPEIKLTQKGLKQLKDKNYGEALALLKRAAESSEPVALYNLAEMYNWGNGVPANKEEALNWYTKAAKQIENKKIRADAYNNMAYYFLDQIQYDKALAVIDSAIETRPNIANYYDSKGEILYHKGDKLGAKEMWNIVMKLDSDFLKSHNSELYKLLFDK